MLLLVDAVNARGKAAARQMSSRARLTVQRAEEVCVFVSSMIMNVVRRDILPRCGWLVLLLPCWVVAKVTSKIFWRAAEVEAKAR